ncbi:MAG: VOC family protein [Oscillospiraceae bacterium]|nr:VOC family protein [Oscillospiraceae bacterium]
MRFHHICIETDCYERSLAFYTGVLGMTVLRQTPDFHGRAYNTWLSGDGFCIELQTPKRGEAQSAPADAGVGLRHFCLCVDDLDAVCAALKAARARFQTHGGGEIYSVGDVRLCKAFAPEGTVIEFRDTAEI